MKGVLLKDSNTSEKVKNQQVCNGAARMYFQRERAWPLLDIYLLCFKLPFHSYVKC